MARSILFVFAHPDDESFSGVGTAMKYASDGVRSVLVTATRGQSGKCGDPPLCAPEELPAWRESELREAAGIAGLDEVHVLDYRDRELASAPPADIGRTLVAHVRRVRPTVVVTFDPDGFNVHPDHVAISRFVSAALSAAADPRWWPDAGEAYTVPRLVWTPPVAPWEAARNENLDARAGIDFIIDIAAWSERKAAALRAHRTQHLSIDRYFFKQPDLDRILSIECWRQGWGPPLPSRPSRDLFEGLPAGV